MTRRTLLQTAATLVAGQTALNAVPQGREFRPYAPPTTTKGRIIDTHVHPWFQDEKPDEPTFSTRAWNSSRPDGDFQMNATWEQFQYDMGAVDKAVILHVARDNGVKGNEEMAAIAKRTAPRQGDLMSGSFLPGSGSRPGPRAGGRPWPRRPAPPAGR